MALYAFIAIGVILFVIIPSCALGAFVGGFVSGFSNSVKTKRR